MFKSLDLSLIVEFILMFYRDKPIDWLLDHILWVKVCNPEKDAVSRGYLEPAQTLPAHAASLAVPRWQGEDRHCWLRKSPGYPEERPHPWGLD